MTDGWLTFTVGRSVHRIRVSQVASMDGSARRVGLVGGATVTLPPGAYKKLLRMVAHEGETRLPVPGDEPEFNTRPPAEEPGDRNEEGELE